MLGAQHRGQHEDKSPPLVRWNATVKAGGNTPIQFEGLAQIAEAPAFILCRFGIPHGGELLGCERTLLLLSPMSSSVVRRLGLELADGARSIFDLAGAASRLPRCSTGGRCGAFNEPVTKAERVQRRDRRVRSIERRPLCGVEEGGTFFVDLFDPLNRVYHWSSFLKTRRACEIEPWRCTHNSTFQQIATDYRLHRCYELAASVEGMFGTHSLRVRQSGRDLPVRRRQHNANRRSSQTML